MHIFIKTLYYIPNWRDICGFYVRINVLCANLKNMKVYLDNNIFVSIEDKLIDLESLKKLSEQKMDFVYSYAHIAELLEAKDLDGSFKNQRINTIWEVTKNYYSYPVGDLIEFKIENPENVISIFKRHTELNTSLRNLIKNFRVDREEIIRLLGINKKQINNYNATEVVNHLNTILEKKLPIDFIQMIQRAGSMLHEKIYSVFNFLDILGYWIDKKNEKSNIARANDATHVFFASGCDYFVSDDRRARNKAMVAYELFDIKTQIYSYEEFKKNKNQRITKAHSACRN